MTPKSKRFLFRLAMLACSVSGLLSCREGTSDSSGADSPTLATKAMAVSSWDTVSPLATAVGQSATSLKVAADSTTLSFRVDGSGLGGYYDLFINAGQQPAPWTSPGADFLIENGRVYRFAANAWLDLGTAGVTSTASAAAVEVTVAKSALVGLASSFSVGFKDISTSWALQSALPTAGSLAAYPRSIGFVVDGSAREWTGVEVLATATGQAATTLKATFNDDSLSFVIQGSGLGGSYSLFLNTDDNAATGFAGAHGAEYLVQNGRLYQSMGPAWSWSDLGTASVQEAKNASTVELRVSRAAMGTLAEAITVRFDDLDGATWNVRGTLPTTSFARLSLMRFGKGLIVPAYLSVGARFPADPSYDASLLAGWTVLAEAALTVKNGTDPAYKDFWVVVNSNNGPFTPTDPAWAYAASLWDPIRANGGLIFGYVHTCMSPMEPLVEQYRPLEAVKQDITAWVTGYPNLGGIWIDEFYPRYEISNSDWTSFFPNGAQNAPTDRAWYDSRMADGRPNWDLQVNPSGGYYDQLTHWIRATYPNLRIIGNAGGQFYSNQKGYSKLVDVTCSFEQNLAEAMSPALDWSGLNHDPGNGAKGQLALIHGNTTDLYGAMVHSITKGYSHLYTTDRLLESNVWGGIASYLTDEVQFVANTKPAAPP